jgi:mono/diheme cytochrome c family protein
MMARYRLDLLLLVLLGGTLAIAFSVRRDVSQPNYAPLVEGQMGRSPAYDSFAFNPNFADGLTLRLPPAGTIARGQMPFHYKATPDDAVRAGVELHNPFTSKDERRLSRGSVVFASFCQVCHGPFGQGDGPVTLGGFPPPPSLAAERAIHMPEGQMFHVLTRGQGRMPSVAPQLSPEDRWCAVLYVRQLQQSHTPPGSPGAVTLKNMALLFKQDCAGCHGEDGTGNLIRKALPNIPDFTSLAWQVSQTEMALVNQIDYGSLPLMPSFRYKLTREQIQGLAVYVRSFSTRQPATPGAPAAVVTANLSPVAVFQTYCFACHETTGKGNTFMRATMPELPDFTSATWQQSRTDKDLGQSILEGKGKFMLPMKDKLGPVNVKDMVALVREFKGGKKVIPLAEPKPAGPPPPVGGGIAKLPDDLKEILPPRVVSPSTDVSKPLPAPSGELAAKIRVGAGIYQQFCLVCHGPTGTGNTVRPAMPPIPDFTNRAWQKSKSDAELQVSILEGKGTLMPPNNTRVTRDQARNLVAYIRAFGGIRIEPGAAVTDDQFEKSFRQLQKQWDELEKQLKQLKGEKKP